MKIDGILRSYNQEAQARIPKRIDLAKYFVEPEA